LVSRALVYGIDYTIWADHIDRTMLIRARRKGKIKCFCGKHLTFVDSTIRIPHFRHLKGNCSIIGVERDTETHNEGLEYVGQILKNKLKDMDVEKETTFKIHGGKRRTDIFVKFKGDTTICYELQCSPISENEFVNRTIAYDSLGHELVWIFGPEASGLRYPPSDFTKDISKGSRICIKFVALSALKESGYLALYSPTQQERLWIAYCADGVYDRTRDITLTRGEKQFVVSLPEVELTTFPLEFGQDGLPYARNFPRQQIDVRNGNSAKIEKLRAVYARELHLNEHTTRPKPTRPPKQRPKKPSTEKKTWITKNGPICIVCGSAIRDQHYHKCVECGSILDDKCTRIIEKALHEEEHNTTGWVRHCEWVKILHLERGNEKNS